MCVSQDTWLGDKDEILKKETELNYYFVYFLKEYLSF